MIDSSRFADRFQEANLGQCHATGKVGRQTSATYHAGNLSKIPSALQRTAKELEQRQALLQVHQAAANSAQLMAPVARRKVRKEIEKVCLSCLPLLPEAFVHLDSLPACRRVGALQ